MIEAPPEDQESSVPETWRPTLAAIVDSLVRRDVEVGAGIQNVTPTPPELSAQCFTAVDHYGDATLIALPDQAWETSVAAWVSEGRWECLVDLWTVEEGRSDLVLHVRVARDADDLRFMVRLVYVP